MIKRPYISTPASDYTPLSFSCFQSLPNCVDEKEIHNLPNRITQTYCHIYVSDACIVDKLIIQPHFTITINKY